MERRFFMDTQQPKSQPAGSTKTCGKCARVFTGEDDFMRDTSQWRMCQDRNLYFNCSCGSTMMLPEGKYDWYSPDKTMSVEAATLFNRLAILGTLPHIPAAIVKIQMLIQDEMVPAEKLGAAIRSEPLIASTLLRTASNVKFARTGDKTPIDSVEHAITYVGLDMVGQIALMASLKSFKLRTQVFTPDVFWDEAFTVAHFAALIGARFAPHIPKDHIYLAACLANIGKIVAAIVNPNEVDDTYRFLNEPKTLCTWKGAEKRLQRFPHTILGEVGGAIWGFPRYVLESARFHHEPQLFLGRVPAGSLSTAEIVALSINLAHWARLEPSRMDRDLMLELGVKIKLNEDDLMAFVTEYRKTAPTS